MNNFSHLSSLFCQSRSQDLTWLWPKTKGGESENHFGFELLFKGKHAQYSSHFWSLRTFISDRRQPRTPRWKENALLRYFPFNLAPCMYYLVSCWASSCVNDFLAWKSGRNLQHKMPEGLLLVVVRSFRTFSFKCFSFYSADAKRVVITLTFYHLVSRSNCLST